MEQTYQLSKIATANKIDVNKLKNYLQRNGVHVKSTFLNGDTVTFQSDDEYQDAVAKCLKMRDADQEAAEAAAQKKREAAEAKKQAEMDKQQALASMLITSGFNFDGYTIKKYSGYISGDDVVQIDRGRQGIFASATNVGDALSAALVKIRRQALQELKENAYALGCNAVIGVDFDYITLEPETVNANGGTLYLPYVFCVTANGNAVIIEKDNPEDEFEIE